MTCDGQVIFPEVYAQCGPGFFRSTTDGYWTCYRRNYFSVACGFGLSSNCNIDHLQLSRGGVAKDIRGMGLRLAARVANAGQKEVELVKYTVLRDKGSKELISVRIADPTSALKVSDYKLI